jgi:hypothetical protein
VQRAALGNLTQQKERFRAGRRQNESDGILFAVNVRACRVSYTDTRGIRHSVEVEAESLYEAAVLGLRRLEDDPWLEPIGPATVLDVDVRAPATSHAISLQQVERWLAGTTKNPSESMKKAKLKMLLVKR